MNQFVIVGRHAKDPVTGTGKDQKPYAFIRIAIENFKLVDGVSTKIVNYLNIACYDKNAINVAKFQHKGDGVVVSGYIKEYTKKDDNGKVVSSTNTLIAKRIIFTGRSAENQTKWNADKAKNVGAGVMEEKLTEALKDAQDEAGGAAAAGDGVFG